MDSNSAPFRRRAGRPRQHDDDLRLLLFVELGSSAAGISVNRFCETHRFDSPDGRVFHKATLKRRYYQRKAWMRPALGPWSAEAPSPLAAAWDRYLADIRATFARGASFPLFPHNESILMGESSQQEDSSNA